MKWGGWLVHMGTTLVLELAWGIGHTFGIETSSGQGKRENMSSSYKRDELVLFLCQTQENIPLMGPQNVINLIFNNPIVRFHRVVSFKML